MRIPPFALLALLLIGSVPLAAQASFNRSDPAQGSATARYGSWGVDLMARDLSIRAGDDFWAHANSNWFRNNPIPPDRLLWGIPAQMDEALDEQLKGILETASRSARDESERQVGDMYASWMDEETVERLGTTATGPWLDRIESVGSRRDLVHLFAAPALASPIELGIIADPADPRRYVATAVQAGLGLPSRDYYLLVDERHDQFRSAYRDYIIALYRLAGVPVAERKADAVIALERRIAEAHWTAERSRDVRQVYNPMDLERLTALAPQFEWPALLDRAGMGSVGTVIVGQPSAISTIGQLLEDTPLHVWKDWMVFHFLNSHAEYLPRAFDEAKFNFRRTLYGVEEQRERSKRGIELLNGTLGEALGRLYVERHYPPEARRQMSELIANLRSAFADRLRDLGWMDEPTRAAALSKLDAFDAQIGHPDTFIDYSPVHIERMDLLGNVIRAREFGWSLQVERLTEPVDRSVWIAAPQTNNAFYNPLTNQITFPAGRLRPPFFDPHADPAANYGAIGAVIGHEMVHGFDDRGRLFDPAGRLRNWWTPTSSQQFAERAARLGQQYSQYEPLPGLRVNGDLTMGENIADLGGLEIAYAAYRRHVASHGEPPEIDGLSGDQRFFLAFAQSRRIERREGALRRQILTGPHSPDMFRVNGVVRNVDAWYQAFDVQPGDSLYLPPEARVRIW